ncbi:MAG: NAD(P)H-quinone oxidoreductase [Gemmatimonadales bacterium]
MRVIRYRGAGGPDVMVLDDHPDPVPGPGQVRVRVAAAGLNRADIIQRRGSYPAPAGWPPDIPGLEDAGVVEALGPGVTAVRAGDRVMGLVGGGAQAELVVTHEREVIPVPDRLTDAEAAAVPEAFLTAWDGLFVRGRLARGERVLIHAAGSGVGTAAIQLARRAGASVAGTSRTAAKLAQARDLGLDEAIDTASGRFGDLLSGPVDVILDFLGGPALAENLAALRTRGRLVVLGSLQGGVAELVEVSRILRGRLEVIGSVMRSRPHEERVALVEDFLRGALPGLADGALRPVIGGTYPMARIAEAHAAMEANEVFGKIVLTW